MEVINTQKIVPDAEKPEIGTEILAVPDPKTIVKTKKIPSASQLAGLRKGMETIRARRIEKDKLKEEKVKAGLLKPYSESTKQRMKREEWEEANKSMVISQSEVRELKEMLSKKQAEPKEVKPEKEVKQLPEPVKHKEPPKILSGSALLDKIFFGV